MVDLNIAGVSVFESPELRNPHFVAAFGGWADAGEVATGSLRYLIARLGAKRFARLDHEEFYDLSTVRPLVIVEEGEYKGLRYPSNDLFYWKDEASERGLICLLGTEPHLRWRKYTDTILDIARHFDVTRIISLGGLFDALPHTKTPRISGTASSRDLRDMLSSLSIQMVDYQGPSSIHSALSIACSRAGFESVSLWGHAPLYVRTPANPKVCHAILSKLCTLIGYDIDLEGIKSAGEYLDSALNRLLAQNEQLRLYVRRLEEQFEGPSDKTPAPESGEPAEEDTQRIIRDVEEFLRREQRRRESGDE